MVEILQRIETRYMKSPLGRYPHTRCLSYTCSLKYYILIMHVMFVVRFAAIGRNQTNLNVQNTMKHSEVNCG